METPIQKLINGIKINMDGLDYVIKSRNVTQLERQWHVEKYRTLEALLMDLEANYLHIEKQQIETAFNFGFKYGKENNDFQNSDRFYNEMYPKSLE